MASKRIATTALDWGVLAAKIPAENKTSFAGLKLKVEKHMRIVNALPAELQALDFAVYRAKITVPGMVDTFEKNYKGLQVPYPADQGRLAEIDAQAAEQKQQFTGFVAESSARIAAMQTELLKWEAMQPVEEMNLEEALDAGLTDYVIDPEKPSLFPHDETWEHYVERLKNADPEEHH